MYGGNGKLDERKLYYDYGGKYPSTTQFGTLIPIVFIMETPIKAGRKFTLHKKVGAVGKMSKLLLTAWLNSGVVFTQVSIHTMNKLAY